MNKLEIAMKKRKYSKRTLRQTRLFFSYISPWLICFFVFGVYPLSLSFYYAFTKYNIASAPKWVGLFNFKYLFKDEVFFKAMMNTFKFALIKTPLSIILSFAAALLLNQKLRGVKLFRTLFYLPAVVPAAASILVWAYIFDSKGLMSSAVSVFDVKPFSYILDLLVGKRPVAWFGERNVLYSLIFMSLWGIGPNMLIILAALQAIPQTYYEVMDIDGASWGTKFRRVTLPMMSPTLLYVVLMGLVSSTQVYAEMHLATGGGPNYASTSMVYLVYQYTFNIPSMLGLASALSWIILVITVLLSILVFKISAKRVFYMGE